MASDTGAGIASTGLLTQTMQPAPNLPPDAAPVVTRYRYNPTYDLIEADRPNGGKILYTYDGLHHQVASTAEQLSATTWRGTLTTYDPFGELLATTDGRGVSVSADGRTMTPNSTADAYTRRYTYTAQGDLLSVSTPPITTTLGANTPVTTTYGYDLDGNLSTMTTPNGNTTTYSYDALGRLVQTTQPPVTLWDGRTAAPTESLGYDGDGHVITSTDGAGDTTTDTYDPLGRLISTVNPVGATTLYTYSATTLSAVQDPAATSPPMATMPPASAPAPRTH